MSFSITPATALGAVSSAGKLVSQLVSKVSHDIPTASFADVLDPSSVAEELSSVVQRIADRLAQYGIGSGESIELTSRNGDVRVVGDHPRAAEIEGLLSDTPELGVMLSQVLSRAGKASVAVELP